MRATEDGALGHTGYWGKKGTGNQQGHKETGRAQGHIAEGHREARMALGACSKTGTEALEQDGHGGRTGTRASRG
jgi:hypothetical protein